MTTDKLTDQLINLKPHIMREQPIYTVEQMRKSRTDQLTDRLTDPELHTTGEQPIYMASYTV